MTSRRVLFLLALVLLLAAIASGGALAGCINPDRAEGTITYNTTVNVPQYCNGTDWIAFGALNPGAGGSGCTDPDGPEGKLAYNTDYHVLQYCDGDDWRSVGSGRISGGHGFLGFSDLVNQPGSTLLLSNILQVTLAGGSAPISIVGDGGPEYRLCVDHTCAAEIQAWGSSPGIVGNGEYLQLRLTSNAVFGVTNAATIAVGVSSDQWDVTAGQDTTPDGFSFVDQTNVAEATFIESNTVNITGINDDVSVSISGDGSPQFRIDGGTWTNGPATIADGQSLQLRLTSGGFDETRLATVTVGTIDDQWSVSTGSQDASPNAFSFTDQTNVAVSTVTESNTLAIDGITGSVSVSISGDGSPEFRIDGGSWTSGPATITDGQTLQLRLTSNGSFSTMNSATVTVGEESDQWNVTTLDPVDCPLPWGGDIPHNDDVTAYQTASVPFGNSCVSENRECDNGDLSGSYEYENCTVDGQDNTPDAFSFTDQTGVALNTQISSNTINITGITGSVPVSISGSGGPEFRIDGGSWVTNGSITNGQTLQLRLTSSASFDTIRSATVTVGTENDQWDVTTVVQDTTPDAFSFTDQTNVALNTLITSNSVTINGIAGTISVSVSGAGSPQVRVNGGSWTTGPTTITNGQSLEVRLTSANADSTMRSATVTVGSGSDQWDVTTQDQTPDAFTFTDVTNQALNTLITSNSVTINGITGTVNVSVSGAGSPQVRVNGGSWTTGPTTIINGQSLEVRLTSANADSTMRSATVTVGSGSNQWDVTTQDQTPNAFSFTDQTGVALSTLTTSNSLTINGITGTVNVSVSGSGSPQIRINGGSWVTSGTITNGQSLQVRLTSSASYSTANSATVTVGSGSDNWSVTTQANFTMGYMSYQVTGNGYGSHSSKSWTGVSFGAAEANRYIIVIVQSDGTGNASHTSVTIGGVAATQVVQQAANTTQPISIWIAQPSGTSGTIVTNYSGAQLGSSIMVYRMTNPSSATPYHTAGASGVSGVVTMNLNVPSGGVGIAGVSEHSTSPVPGTKTWSGVTKDVEVNVWDYADISAARGGTPGTTQQITATSSITNPYFGYVGVSASWGP